MSIVEVPQPTTPLTQAVTDAQVIEGKTDAPQKIFETDEARVLLRVVQEYDRMEEFARYSLVKRCRKHLNYWNDLQYLAWDEMAHDWRTAEDILEQDPTSDIDPAIYAKVVNIYKAHGEIFIGALSSGTPAIRFFPEDADLAEDVAAAKAKSKLAELIAKQNKARLLIMKSLFILFNQGMVAGYNENKSSYRFGKITAPAYSTVDIVDRGHFCPACGADLGHSMHDPQQLPQPVPEVCSQCGQQNVPLTEDTTQQQQVQIGETSRPKNRECIEVYGPLNVKVPLWIREQSSTPYLILETEEDLSLIKEIYSEYADQISSAQFPDNYDKEARISTIYKNDYPRNLVTVQRVWLRPWALNIYGTNEPELIASIRQKYPDGVYVVILNNTLVVEIVKDSLDDHWTLSENPLAESLHANPIGSSLIPMQDITNELMNLTLETVEFGIPETFADSRVIDFDAYQRQEARPGQLSRATAPAGQGLSAGFFEMKAATLSREVDGFASRVEQSAQFVQGTYPSIYGGTQEGGGGTAREYELSKASALQRLSSSWVIVLEWYCSVMEKAVNSSARSMQEDEKHVTSQGDNFLNVWIKKADLEGNTSRVEPEVAENFPLSWSQKRDVLLHLLEMKDPNVAAVITHPENAALVASIIGVSELHIPGDDDRNKQLMEIAELIRTEPTVAPPDPNNPHGVFSSIPVTPDLDKHEIESEVCKTWLVSPVGQDAKKNNPAGYANVLAHKREHDFFLAREAQAQMAMDQQGKDNQGKDKLDNKGLNNADSKPDSGQP